MNIVEIVKHNNGQINSCLKRNWNITKNEPADLMLRETGGRGAA